MATDDPRARTDLDVASLLHELRQPLFAVKATAQLGLADAPEHRERWALILDQVAHMESILAHHRDPRQVPREHPRYDLSEAVRAAVDTLAHRQRRSGALLELVLSPHPLVVQLRPSAARQIAVILLTNALDAVEDVEGRRVRVHTERRANMAVLVVEDSGQGVSPAVRKDLFKPWVTSKPPDQGTGLGLYIAQQIVHDAGGELSLEGRRGGTRAVVELPIEPS